MLILPYIPDHAQALAELRHASITALGPEFYSPAQIQAWIPEMETVQAVRTRCEDGRQVFNAVHNEQLIGSIDLEADGHIDFLYVHPSAARQGVAMQLISHVQNRARDQGLTRLFTEASELARFAFQKAGFQTLHRRDFTHNGISIHNYAMEKQLEKPLIKPEANA